MQKTITIDNKTADTLIQLLQGAVYKRGER